VLDEFKPYLHERWNAGCTTVWTLFTEIRGRGYPGSYSTVRDYLQPFRELGVALPAVPAPPKVRDVTSWMLRHPDTLDADEQVKLKEVLARCPDIDAAAGHLSADPRRRGRCDRDLHSLVRGPVASRGVDVARVDRNTNTWSRRSRRAPPGWAGDDGGGAGGVGVRRCK